ncbi:MAG: response regulator transcription factor [Chloroflexi bacterium]|nr:response regulator transcription factor [Chloroflexota bacterium]MCH8196087.1 response regulator transcription factor [Chloroflexota bacterium]MCI0769588.1 response regulator transcription factor [Chloroflexota bacterium]
MPQRTILLVEDEETLARAVAFTLEREGYRMLTAADGAVGLAMAREAKPDLLLLDVMLPNIDGFDLCRILRRETTMPILMLTAKVDEVDRIVGLELGADDYLTKPFSMRELVARIKALFRRIEMDLTEKGKALPPPVLDSDGLRLDPAARVVTLRGKPVSLRPKEFDLLAFLLGNAGIVFSRDVLLERVWGYEYTGDTRTVDVHVRWLREKIEDDPGKPRRLVTMRGVGYKLEA